MAVLKLQLLGGFKLQNEAGQEIAIPARKGRALLATLAVSPSGTASREKLAALLWSDRGEDQARSSLRQTLTVLRKELGIPGANLIVADDQRVELARDTMEIDAVSIVSLSKTNDVLALRRAANLYQGEFLADGAVSDPMFEEWLAGERSRFRDLMISILDRLLTLEPAVERVALAKRLLALDPLREASHLFLMKAYADSGERSMALQHYSLCRDLLKSELNVQPGHDIEQLRLRLTSEGPAVAAKSHSSSPAPQPAGHDAKSQEKPSIAVLPFTNLSGDLGQQYLSDGITEDIIIQLARFRELQVAARSATFRFQSGDIESGEATRSLGARYVVKGTARKNGTRLIISCQLLEGATENLLWGERYDREATDIFSVQDEVVARIVTALGGRVVTEGALSAHRKPTESWSAYDYFLQGRDLCNAGNEYASEPFFAKAVERDPEFTLAHAWLAIGLLGKFWFFADRKFLHLALASAERALALDPNEAMAHHATGTVLNYLAKFERSEFHLLRALELNPLEVNVSTDYANLLLHTGRNAEALAIIEELLRRDPYPPPWISYIHGKILFFSRRFEEAIRALDNGSVYNYRAHALLAAAHAMAGNLDEAHHQVGLMKTANPHLNLDAPAVTLPFADPAVLDFLRAALRKAGFGD
jgi:TolB-like protein